MFASEAAVGAEEEEAAAAAAESAAAKPLQTVILPEASPTANLSSSPSTATAPIAFEPEDSVRGLRRDGAPARQAQSVLRSAATTTPPPDERERRPPAAASLKRSGSSFPVESFRRMIRPAVPPAQEVER